VTPRATSSACTVGAIAGADSLDIAQMPDHVAVEQGRDAAEHLAGVAGNGPHAPGVVRLGRGGPHRERVLAHQSTGPVLHVHQVRDIRTRGSETLVAAGGQDRHSAQPCRRPSSSLAPTRLPCLVFPSPMPYTARGSRDDPPTAGRLRRSGSIGSQQGRLAFRSGGEPARGWNYDTRIGWVVGSQGFSQTESIAIVLAFVLDVAWMTWLAVVAWRMKDSPAAPSPN
jgi:hypothetical protein